MYDLEADLVSVFHDPERDPQNGLGTTDNKVVVMKKRKGRLGWKYQGAFDQDLGMCWQLFL